MEVEVPFVLGLAIIAIAAWAIWWFYKRKVEVIHQMPDVPRTIPPGGFPVPVLATFTGLKRMPRQTSVSHNNFNPRLTLYEDRIEYRVLASNSLRLSDIEVIDIWDTWGTRNLHVDVKGRPATFAANLFGRRNLAQVLRFLADRNVRLTNRARAFMLSHGTRRGFGVGPRPDPVRRS